MDAVMEFGSLEREARSVAAGLVAEQRAELGSLLGPESPFQVLHRAKLAAAEQCAARMGGSAGPFDVETATVYGIAYRLLLESCIRMNVRIAARVRAGRDVGVAA
ncbi:hypothetical protein GCM10027059_48450 [Myceligenerans halotolerans]